MHYKAAIFNTIYFISAMDVAMTAFSFLNFYGIAPPAVVRI